LPEQARRAGPGQLPAARALAELDEPTYVELFRQLVKASQGSLDARLESVAGLGASGELLDLPLLAYEHPIWTGTYEVVVQKTGYKPLTLSAHIEPGNKEARQANLELLPPPPPGRPLWRTVTGAIAVGLGGTMGLLSTSSLFSSDSNQVATGAGVTALGAGLAVGGVLLLTLPSAKPKAPPPPPK